MHYDVTLLARELQCLLGRRAAARILLLVGAVGVGRQVVASEEALAKLRSMLVELLGAEEADKLISLAKPIEEPKPSRHEERAAKHTSEEVTAESSRSEGRREARVAGAGEANRAGTAAGQAGGQGTFTLDSSVLVDPVKLYLLVKCSKLLWRGRISAQGSEILSTAASHCTEPPCYIIIKLGDAVLRLLVGEHGAVLGAAYVLKSGVSYLGPDALHKVSKIESPVEVAVFHVTPP